MVIKNTLTVSFEIAWSEAEKQDYQKIYDALNSAIQDGLSGSDYWLETTSCYVVRATESASELLVRVWNASGMRSKKDRILVLDANVKTGAAFGHFTDNTVFELLPFVSRLSAKK